MQEIKDFVINAKPNLSPNSVVVYSRNINKLLKELGLEWKPTITQLKAKKQAILDFTKEYNTNTARNYLNSAIVLLQAIDHEGAEEMLVEIGKERDSLHQKYVDKVDSNKKNDKQKANWLEWAQVLEIHRDLENKVRERRIKSRAKTVGHTSASDRILMQDLVILSLYTLIPPTRNDYSMMEVISPMKYRKLVKNKEEAKDTNYFIDNRQGISKFVYNEYKTSKTHGRVITNIPPRLNRIITAWLKINTTGYLLINNRGEPMTPNGITKNLNKIFKEYTGKSISSSMLRHIFKTHSIGDAVKKNKEESKAMMHSEDQANDYVLLD